MRERRRMKRKRKIRWRVSGQVFVGMLFLFFFSPTGFYSSGGVRRGESDREGHVGSENCRWWWVKKQLPSLPPPPQKKKERKPTNQHTTQQSFPVQRREGKSLGAIKLLFLWLFHGTQICIFPFFLVFFFVGGGDFCRGFFHYIIVETCPGNPTKKKKKNREWEKKKRKSVGHDDMRASHHAIPSCVCVHPCREKKRWKPFTLRKGPPPFHCVVYPP